MAEEVKRPKKDVDNSITPGRIVAWVIIAGVGLVLIITGIVGIIAKG